MKKLIFILTTMMLATGMIFIALGCAPPPVEEETVTEEVTAPEEVTEEETPPPAEAITLKIDYNNQNDPDFDKDVAEWTAKTGIKVEVVPAVWSATDRLAQLLTYVAAQSPDIDIYQIDVIWPGILAEHMVDLKEYIPQEEIAQYFPAIVENNTVNGKLVGIPWFTDVGMLYYRTDLLEKYGYAEPPKTWDELEEMALKIQEGERAAGNESFWGFVWQGKAYEGLTCDALEWQVSHDGGYIIEPDGKITINNPNAIAAFERAKGWIGKISPPGVTTYTEEESRAVWQSGNAAFMRNWPYAYSLGMKDDSPIKGKFDVTSLPRAGSRSAATLGGWQLSVSKYSKHPKEAAELVRWLTSREFQKRNVLKQSLQPTIPDLYADPDVLEFVPFFAGMIDAFNAAVARPSTVTGEKYGEVSAVYFQEVNKILTGEKDAATAVADMEKEFQRIMGTE